MSTVHQIEANRLNAQKSTGPRSAEGKAASSLNALKSGIETNVLIIPGECPSVLFALQKEYTERHQPATPEERVLVDTLIRAEWQLRRLDKVEHHHWESRFKDEAKAQGADMLYARDLENLQAYGRVYRELDKTFARLQRRIDSFNRSYRTTLHELKRLQSDRQAQLEAAPAPAPPPQPIATEPTCAQIGFVPQTTPELAPAAQIGFVPALSPAPTPQAPVSRVGFSDFNVFKSVTNRAPSPATH
jgi:hypothetical protein